AVLNGVLDLLDPLAITVTGEPLVTYVDGAPIWDGEVIRSRAEPLLNHGGINVLRGNLAPNGAVLKPTAASPELLQHRGRAVVFENHQQMQEQIDSQDLPVDRDAVLVMKSCGPKGAPGFPEWGQIPMPSKLLRQGVQDMV